MSTTDVLTSDAGLLKNASECILDEEGDYSLDEVRERISSGKEGRNYLRMSPTEERDDTRRGHELALLAAVRYDRCRRYRAANFGRRTAIWDSQLHHVLLFHNRDITHDGRGKRRIKLPNPRLGGSLTLSASKNVLVEA